MTILTHVGRHIGDVLKLGTLWEFDTVIHSIAHTIRMMAKGQDEEDRALTSECRRQGRKERSWTISSVYLVVLIGLGSPFVTEGLLAPTPRTLAYSQRHSLAGWKGCECSKPFPSFSLRLSIASDLWRDDGDARQKRNVTASTNDDWYVSWQEGSAAQRRRSSDFGARRPQRRRRRRRGSSAREKRRREGPFSSTGVLESLRRAEAMTRELLETSSNEREAYFKIASTLRTWAHLVRNARAIRAILELAQDETSSSLLHSYSPPQLMEALLQRLIIAQRQQEEEADQALSPLLGERLTSLPVEELLESFLQQEQDHQPPPPLMVTAEWYRLVLGAWADWAGAYRRVAGRQSACSYEHRTTSALSQLFSLSRQRRRATSAASSSSFSSSSFVTPGYPAAERASELLHAMYEQSKRSPTKSNVSPQRTKGAFLATGEQLPRPSRACFLSVFAAWFRGSQSEQYLPKSKRWLLQCANRAVEDLHWMQTVSQTSIAWQPDLSFYRKVVATVANSATISAGQRAEQLLLDAAHHVQPDTYCYNRVVFAWTQAGRALVLQEKKRQVRRANGEDTVNHRDFEANVTATHRLALPSSPREAAESAERVLHVMESSRISFMAPDAWTYNQVIDAWAVAGCGRYGAERAEALLRRMTVNPNVQTYNSVIKAWKGSVIGTAETCHEDALYAAERVEQLLEQMSHDDRDMDDQSGEEEIVEPDRVTYNTYMRILSLLGTTEGAKRTEALLNQMERAAAEEQETNDLMVHRRPAPNAFSYDVTIESWLRAPDVTGPTRALSVLRRLMRQPNGVSPSARTYTLVIQALAESQLAGAARLAEDLLSTLEEATNKYDHWSGALYESLLYSWSICGHADAGFRAEALLDKMERLYEETSNPDLKPTLSAFNSVINAWARSGLGMWGARRAEHILQRMEEQDDDWLQPNAQSYNGVLSAWARSGTLCAHRKAEELLERMSQLYETTGNDSIKPDVYSYNSVISAIALSVDVKKAPRALRILRTMDRRHRQGWDTRPDESTYRSVLTSCANFPDEGKAVDARTRRVALCVAQSTLEESRPRDCCDSVSYRNFLKACGTLLEDNPYYQEDDRRDIIRRAFEQCCADGQVCDAVLQELQAAAPPDLYHELTFGGAPLEELPLEWRREQNSRGLADEAFSMPQVRKRLEKQQAHIQQYIQEKQNRFRP